MFLCCPFCKSPTQFAKADDADLVIDGNPVCHRVTCKSRAMTIFGQAQRKQEPFQLPLRFIGDP